MATPQSYGTPYTSLIKAARLQIRAARGSGANYHTDAFWDDEELFQIALRGTTDLWGAYIDLHQEHFLTFNATDVSLQSGAAQLTGVPLDTFRVYLIEPLDLTTWFQFEPRARNHIDFRNALMASAITPFSPSRGARIYYCLTGEGAPNAAPVVLTAPILTATVAVNFGYVPSLGVRQYKLETATNPIPGESDQALIQWIIAFMRAKERDDRSPDPAALAVYQTEKNSLLTRCEPRQEQEALCVDGMFDDYWKRT